MATDYLQVLVGIGLRHACPGCSLDVARVLLNLATWQCWQIFQAEGKNKRGTFKHSVIRGLDKKKSHFVWINLESLFFLGGAISRTCRPPRPSCVLDLTLI